MNDAGAGKGKIVLLVDEDEGDARLTELGLLRKDPTIRFVHKRSRFEAAEYLDQGNGGVREVPTLILLSLDLSDGDGYRLLEDIKRSDDLALVPTIVTTRELNEVKIERAYTYRANCFIVKPDDPVKLTETVYQLESFWFETAVLPSGLVE